MGISKDLNKLLDVVSAYMSPITPSNIPELIILPNDTTSSSTVEGTPTQLDENAVFGVNTENPIRSQSEDLTSD